MGPTLFETEDRLSLSAAIELYIADMRAEGRLTSDRSIDRYRSDLLRHAEDSEDRDPRARTTRRARRAGLGDAIHSCTA